MLVEVLGRTLIADLMVARRIPASMRSEEFPIARYGWCWFFTRARWHWHASSEQEPFTELVFCWAVFRLLFPRASAQGTSTEGTRRSGSATTSRSSEAQKPSRRVRVGH